MIVLYFDLSLAYYDSEEEIYVRKNAKDMTFKEWASIKRGIEVMKQRDLFKRTGYEFQANIHGWDKFEGTPDSIEKAKMYGWHRCQHQQYFFLPWHRLYTYFFEKILRQAANDPNLTIPYWDYFDPAQRSIPEPFRLPADPKLNPLYLEERCLEMNRGKPLPTAITNHDPALSSKYFTDAHHPQLLCNSFGGTENDDQGIVEQLPHNPIHVFVGGVGGYLSDNCMSSRDPIFWIHHAQVDRIWESWLNGGGKNNKDIKWLNQSFEFFDEIGTSNMYEVGDVLDIKNQLNYRYDKLIDTGERFKPKVVKFPNILKTAEEIDLDKLRIDRDHRSVVIHLEEPARNLLNDLSKDFNDEIRIKIILHVNIDYIMSGTVFDMYLNLPNNSRPYESTPHYIRPILVLPPGCRKKQSSPRASLPLNVSLCFDVTTNLKQIFKQEANSRGRISNFLNLTFVPNEFCGTYTFNQRADDWINFKTIQFSHYFT